MVYILRQLSGIIIGGYEVDAEMWRATLWYNKIFEFETDGLVHERHRSSANALELCLYASAHLNATYIGCSHAYTRIIN